MKDSNGCRDVIESLSRIMKEGHGMSIMVVMMDMDENNGMMK